MSAAGRLISDRFHLYFCIELIQPTHSCDIQLLQYPVTFDSVPLPRFAGS